jgi:inosine/xanthosine triphosphate pyrophosphatase family protein
MILKNDTRTFAQMSSEENAVSHRRNALEKLKEYLSKEV